jgi:hypothetical protein
VLVVVQNMVTSLFNLHPFDSDEGSMYVLGVGGSSLGRIFRSVSPRLSLRGK